jgi:hypothetical protein
MAHRPAARMIFAEQPPFQFLTACSLAAVVKLQPVYLVSRPG